MKSIHEIPFSFLAQSYSYDEARLVIVPVPFDYAASYGTGSRKGPLAVINASRFIDLQDVKVKSVPKTFTLGDIEPVLDAEKNVARVKGVVKSVVDDGKTPVVIGGDHSQSLAPVLALHEKLSDSFSILSLDAHADLFDSFQESKYSDACWLRRASEKIGSAAVVGVRALNVEEKKYADKKKIKIVTADEAKKGKLDELLASLKDNVYVSIDVDVLDPSIMPATGTPEPNGLSYADAVSLLKAVAERKRVIGLDLMELAPIPGNEAPNYIAAKLLFEFVASLRG